MPPEFQKLWIYYKLSLEKFFVFIDDLVIVTKGTKNEHLAKVREILKMLDLASVQLKAGNANSQYINRRFENRWENARKIR